MLNLQELCPDEAMFILSQLSFGNYLKKLADAAAAAQPPRPSQLNTRTTKYSDCEADFVLIHRQHGILIGELKSVGRHQVDVNNPQPPTDPDVAKRVTKAVKQLNRSERVVRHLVSDVTPGLTVRKTLFLPYVSVKQLKRVLNTDQDLLEQVCLSLGAGNATEAVQLCCCSGQLSQPASYWDVTPAVLSQLSTWWQHRMACTVYTLLTDDKYLDIVARFVGPATTVSVPCYNGGVRVEVRTAGQAVEVRTAGQAEEVRTAGQAEEVRTAGQAVAELGWRLALLVLTLFQLDILNRDPRLVCLNGPPGTEIPDAMQSVTDVAFHSSEQQTQHKELSVARQKRDHTDIQLILRYLLDRNPFTVDTALRSISSGKEAEATVNAEQCPSIAV
ncbi:uncharacterized protein [Littorina saxatilis]|uniref:uncharacterized protein n=1 Tax=Littorina saxatilis TaxID=31220 RepID=UPI0038B66297